MGYYLAYSTLNKRLAFIGSSIALIFACITLAFAFHKYNLDKNDNPAIVFSQESKVKSNPNSRSEESFRLHEGTKVQVLDNYNDVTASRADLEAVRDFYLQNRYLLRLKENLQKLV